MARSRATVRTPRTRRSPEAARVLILDAADRVFAREMPDAVGLREIAAEAAISHGLVTHYFATYDNLVATVLERRLAAAREQAIAKLGHGFNPREQPLLGVLIDLLEDKALVRLLAWSALRGDLVFGKRGELHGLIDAMLAPFVAAGARPNRARFEHALLFAVSTVMGWGVVGDALAAGVGARLDRDQLRTELQRMLFAYIGAP